MCRPLPMQWRIFFTISVSHDPQKVDATAITDIVLNAVDFIRIEMDKLDNGGQPDLSSQELREYTGNFLREMKLANGDDPDIDPRKARNANGAGKSKPKQYYRHGKAGSCCCRSRAGDRRRKCTYFCSGPFFSRRVRNGGGSCLRGKRNNLKEKVLKSTICRKRFWRMTRRWIPSKRWDSGYFL